MDIKSMVIKYLIYVFILLGVFNGGFWVFNHVNPWLGIALVVAGLILVANQILKLFKQKK